MNTNFYLEGTYVLTMQTKNDKTLFLTMMNEKPTWTFDKEDACVWSDDDICRKFANKWFKNFKEWVVREYTSMEIIKE